MSAIDLSARQIFAAAETLEESPARAILLARLALYRRVVFDGLSAMAPRESPRSWSSLLLGLPQLPERASAILSNPASDDALDDAALPMVVAELRAAAFEVLRSLSVFEREYERTAHRRVGRGSTVFVLTFAVVAVGAVMLMRALDPPDLAKGKPWRASSKLYDCHPDKIECGGTATSIFFHTNVEQDPWVEIDLGAPTKFSSVTVHNRSDAVQERAAPLVLEVGDDAVHWKQLAIQPDEFKVWKPSFPAVTARFVRLRVTKQTYFHLNAVKVHP